MSHTQGRQAISASGAQFSPQMPLALFHRLAAGTAPFRCLPQPGLAAALATGDGGEHVYIVEPTGSFENDPNVTNKKFPGNPTRSYRTHTPLKVVGEVTDWVRQTPEELQKWREKLSNVKGDIIN